MFQVKKIIKHYNHLPQYTQSHVVNPCSSSSSVSFILDKDTITCKDLTKQKRLYLGQQANKQSNKIYLHSFLSLEFPNSGDKDAFCSPGIGRRFSSLFQGKQGGQSIFYIILSSISQVTSTQDHHCAVVAYLGVACSDPK